MLWNNKRTFLYYTLFLATHKTYIVSTMMSHHPTSRKAAVCATAAAFVATSSSASVPLPSCPGIVPVTWLSVEPPLGERTTLEIKAASVFSCPRGGGGSGADAPSDESKKKRKSRRRKASQYEPSDTDADTKEQSSAASSTKVPHQSKQAQTNEPADESTLPAQKEAPLIIDEILKQDEYYKILGIDKDCNQIAIQKSYRRRAVQTHPDKTGGDRRAFDKVAEAYDVLNDTDKRKVYDRFGKPGLDPNTSSSAGAANFSGEDLFRSFFGGGRGSNNPYAQQQRRNRTVRYQLEVTLEDLYNGSERTILIAPPSDSDTRTTSAKSKRVSVQVPRGALSGQAIVLSGAMDFDAGETPGDLVFGLAQRAHPTFTRKGHDLAVAVRISLQEAICGVTRTLRHLDGRELVIGSARYETQVPILIENGNVQVLKGQGMPKDGQGTEFGDLYVQYQVDMPTGRGQEGTSLTDQERKELGRLLTKLDDGKEPKQANESASIQYLKKASLADFGRASGRPHSQSRNGDSSFQDEGAGFSPFGKRQFFSSSGVSNPFFNMRQDDDDMYEQDDGSNQCRQM